MGVPELFNDYRSVRTSYYGHDGREDASRSTFHIQSYGLVVDRGLVFLSFGHLSDSLHQVVLDDIIPVNTFCQYYECVAETDNIVTNLSSLIANIPASVHTFRKSAPLKVSES